MKRYILLISVLLFFCVESWGATPPPKFKPIGSGIINKTQDSVGIIMNLTTDSTAYDTAWFSMGQLRISSVSDTNAYTPITCVNHATGDSVLIQLVVSATDGSNGISLFATGDVTGAWSSYSDSGDVGVHSSESARNLVLSTGNATSMIEFRYSTLNAVSNWSYRFPADSGTDGQILKLDANGNMAWGADAGAGGGEANTTSDVGIGFQLTHPKAGVDLPFKTLRAGTGITLDSIGTGLINIHSDLGTLVDTTERQPLEWEEFVSDHAGAMATGNTETGITVTYQDADNTMDYEVDVTVSDSTAGYADSAQYLRMRTDAPGQAYVEGRMFWDSDDDKLYVGNGGSDPAYAIIHPGSPVTNVDTIQDIAIQEPAGNIADNYIMKYNSSSSQLEWESDLNDGDGGIIADSIGDSLVNYFDTATVVDTIQGVLTEGNYATNSQVGDSLDLALRLEGGTMAGSIIGIDSLNIDSGLYISDDITIAGTGDVIFTDSTNKIAMTDGRIDGVDFIDADTMFSALIWAATILRISGEDFTSLTGGDLAFNSGALDIEINVIDSTNIINGSVSMAGDLHSFTQAELETEISDATNMLSESEINASSELLAIMDDETGTGVLVFGTSPTFTTGITVPANSISGDELNEDDAFDWTAAHTFDENIAVNGGKLTGNHSYTFNLFDPNAIYAKDHEVCIDPRTEAALTITRIDVTCDADPATELDFDLKWADAFIGLANAAVIDELNTTAGVTTIITGFDDATVPANKCIYILFNVEPIEAITQISIKITYDYD